MSNTQYCVPLIVLDRRPICAGTNGFHNHVVENPLLEIESLLDLKLFKKCTKMPPGATIGAATHLGTPTPERTSRRQGLAEKYPLRTWKVAPGGGGHGWEVGTNRGGLSNIKVSLNNID